MGASGSSPPEDIVLGDYLSQIVHGWKVVLVTTLLFVGVAALYTATSPRVYQAQATVKLSGFEYCPYRDQSLAVEYLSSSPEPLKGMDPAARRATRLTASPLSSSHVRIVAQSNDPATAAEAANSAALHFVALSNARGPVPTREATQAIRQLRNTRDALQKRVASSSFLSSPPDERQADVMALGMLNSLAAQDQEARAQEALNRLRAAEVIVPAVPSPTPVLPSPKVNLSVALGLGLLVSFGVLSVKSILHQPER